MKKITDLSVYTMYVNRAINSAFKEDSKLKHIPISQEPLFALCSFNYEEKDSATNELLKIFNYHMTTWCYIQIKNLYKINNNEMIPYQNPFLEGQILGSLKVESFLLYQKKINTKLFLMSPNNNINNICLASLDHNSQVVEMNKIEKKEIKSPMESPLLVNSPWTIVEYDLLSSKEILCKLHKKINA